MRNNTNIEAVKCNLCECDEARVVHESTAISEDIDSISCACTNVGHGDYFRVLKCARCGLHYCSPRPTFAYLQELYSEVNDIRYSEELDSRVIMFGRNLKNLEKHKRNGSILDIGCSVGVFLHLAKKSGWRVMGIEPSKRCVESGRKLFNLVDSITVGSYHDIARLNQKFDAVTMWDVLEHLDDPMKALVNCREVMKDDGVLGLSTVNIGSKYARLLGKRWPWLMKMHIYYFDRNTIKQYLNKVGFELLEMKTYIHTVSFDYILYKLKSISYIPYAAAKLFKTLALFNRRTYSNIALGDFMEIYAKKK